MINIFYFFIDSFLFNKFNEYYLYKVRLRIIIFLKQYQKINKEKRYKILHLLLQILIQNIHYKKSKRERN